MFVKKGTVPNYLVITLLNNLCNSISNNANISILFRLAAKKIDSKLFFDYCSKVSPCYLDPSNKFNKFSQTHLKN